MILLPDLNRRDEHAHEQIDALDGDLETLYRTYAYLPVVNALVSGWRGLYVQFVRPHLSPVRVTTLLDIGCGGGDVTRNLMRWADADGLRLEATGIDTDPRAIDYANSLPPYAGLRFYHVSSRTLVEQGQRFDLVVSNHMLHHLTDDEIPPLLDDCRRLARREVLLSDLDRSRFSYVLFAVCTWPFFRNSSIKQDGLISLRRAFTAEELRERLPCGWSYQPQSRYRHLVRYFAPTPTEVNP